MITDFWWGGGVVLEFLLEYHWVGLKPFGHSAVEFFNKGMGFSWRACRDFSARYTCAGSVMGPFIGTASITTSLVAYNKKGITYLAATNARWLPYLVDKGLRYVHYTAHRVMRQFGLD